MRILVTTTRMPFTLNLIRKLGHAGHKVFASDTFDDAPGNHSRFQAEHFVTASPRHETRKFIDDLKRIIQERQIELLLPSMEEVFYISKHLDELSALTKVFCSPFEKLELLHHKARFHEYAGSLGLRVPGTLRASNREELAEACKQFEQYIARPSFSRGGSVLYTNTGPRAGALKLEECEPTAENPWLVQEFIHGTDLCSYSVAREGKLAAHCTYETPVEIQDSYGVQFLAVDRPEAVEMIRTIVEKLNFTGHISFDFKQTAKGPVFIECNPRVTNGSLLLSEEALSHAITDPAPPSSCMMAKIGEKAQIAYGMAAALMEHTITIPRTIKDFATVRDIYIDRHDLMPALYAFMTFRRFENIADREHITMMDAMLEDVAWNGAAIA